MASNRKDAWVSYHAAAALRDRHYAEYLQIRKELNDQWEKEHPNEARYPGYNRGTPTGSWIDRVNVRAKEL
jgi:hypothetical protein